MPVYLDDKRTAKRILLGDECAFEAYFDENFARLYRFAIARLGDDPEAAKEVVLTTFAKALRKMASYRAEASMFTWLCAICRNEISDWCHRHGRYREHIVLVEDLPEVAGAIDSWQAPREDQPDQQYQRAEAVRLIQVALDRLPARYGDVLEWKYVEGHTVKEISGKLGIGTEATQSLLARAKRAFADVYGSLQSAAREDERLVKT